MLVIYPQPASLTPITSDCARPNITERQRTSPHRNHVQCTVQPRRLPATAAVARILHERLVHDHDGVTKLLGCPAGGHLLAAEKVEVNSWPDLFNSLTCLAPSWSGCSLSQVFPPNFVGCDLARFCTTYNISAQHCSPSRNVTQITFST